MILRKRRAMRLPWKISAPVTYPALRVEKKNTLGPYRTGKMETCDELLCVTTSQPAATSGSEHRLAINVDPLYVSQELETIV